MPLHRMVAISRIVLKCNRSNSVAGNPYQHFSCYRFSTSNDQKSSKRIKNDKFRDYIVERYVDYVRNYTKALDTRFPTAMRMYRVFSVGIKDFFKDLKTYIGLRIRTTKDRGFSKMSRQELELYQKMPSDMLRIAPVLILSAVPFGNYIIFPLAYMKPRKLLCSHFWSIQQRAEFGTQDLRERLKYNRPVFRALQAKLDRIPDGDLKEKWNRVIGLLGSGAHPTATEVLACRDLFNKPPYNLHSLTYSHTGDLLKMYGLKKGMLRKNKLKHKAFMLLELDKAILREGGVSEMSTDALRYGCHLRGLNSSHLSNRSMREWLTEWMFLSQHIDKDSYSLLLHCPIFLAYNHPQNWMLIY